MDLPDAVVDHLNGIGFALIGGDTGYTFARPAIGGDLYVTVESVGQDQWQVGLKTRPPQDARRRPASPVTVSFALFGVPTTTGTIDMTTEDLLTTLPRLLGESILPALDTASGEG